MNRVGAKSSFNSISPPHDDKSVRLTLTLTGFVLMEKSQIAAAPD
jgi:hypothetical protein